MIVKLLWKQAFFVRHAIDKKASKNKAYALHNPTWVFTFAFALKKAVSVECLGV